VTSDLVLAAGRAGSGLFELAITQRTSVLQHAALRIITLAPGEEVTIATGDQEMLVLPLSGACEVIADGERLVLAGRRSVFSRVSDFAYVPRDAELTLLSGDGGRFALPAATASRRLPVRYGPAEEVPVELRGAGQATRQVNNFCAPDQFECDRLMAVEVITPAGNWSSYPPHKHDEPGTGEAVVEEIYYFEVDEAERGTGLAYQRVYSSGPDRQIDVLAEVRSGGAVLVPYGYHGPSMAAPGHHLYYLNVLAGPAVVAGAPAPRSMVFCDDPAHTWIRGSWDGEPTDPRLPLTGAAER
jgi:5-deoxy-glucuronate isomerase